MKNGNFRLFLILSCVSTCVVNWPFPMVVYLTRVMDKSEYIKVNYLSNYSPTRRNTGSYSGVQTFALVIVGLCVNQRSMEALISNKKEPKT